MTEKELALLSESVQELETIARVEGLSLPSLRRLRSVQDFLRKLKAIHTPYSGARSKP